MIENFGKGCIPIPQEIKQNHYILGTQIPRVIDWSKPYMVENGFTLVQRNQGGTLSCTAQATSYYGEALMNIDYKKQEIYSARYIYSQTYLPNGGAYINQAMQVPIQKGYTDIKSVPESQDESIMRDSSLNSKAITEALAERYAQLPSKDINYLAQIIEDYGGFVTGFQGNNTIAQKAILDIPDHIDWGHAVYVCGYLTLPDGRKALKFKNSWSSSWGDNGYGYFTEDFIKSPYLFDAYVYADVQDINMYKLVKGSFEDTYFINEEGKRVLIGDYKTLLSFDKKLWDKTTINVISDTELNSIPKGGILVKTDSE